MRTSGLARLMVSALLAAHAEAAVLCTAKSGSGTVRVRAACTANESQLDPVALGLQGPPGPGLVVRDANGKSVGAVLRFWNGQLTQIARNIGGHIYEFIVRADGFSNTGGGYEFKSIDCTGTPFEIADGPASTLMSRFLKVRNGTGYLWQEPFEKVPAGSVISTLLFEVSESECSNYWHGTFTPPVGCCLRQELGVPEYLVPLAPFDMSTLGLIPPFHVEGP